MTARRHLGRMKHRLAIMELVRTPDTGGGFERADAVTAVVWARLRTIGVIEANTYSQLQQRVTHKAMIRTREGIGQGSTVYWINAGATEPEIGDETVANAIALYVVTVTDGDPDGRRGEFLELLLREGGNL